MNAPSFVIETRGVADPQGALDLMRHEARRLSGRYPALASMRFVLERAHNGFEARIDLGFDTVQLVVAGAAAEAEGAIDKAVARAARSLLDLEAREPERHLLAGSAVCP